MKYILIAHNGRACAPLAGVMGDYYDASRYRDMLNSDPELTRDGTDFAVHRLEESVEAASAIVRAIAQDLKLADVGDSGEQPCLLTYDDTATFESCGCDDCTARQGESRR